MPGRHWPTGPASILAKGKTSLLKPTSRGLIHKTQTLTALPLAGCRGSTPPPPRDSLHLAGSRWVRQNSRGAGNEPGQRHGKAREDPPEPSAVYRKSSHCLPSFSLSDRLGAGRGDLRPHAGSLWKRQGPAARLPTVLEPLAGPMSAIPGPGMDTGQVCPYGHRISDQMASLCSDTRDIGRAPHQWSDGHGTDGVPRVLLSGHIMVFLNHHDQPTNHGGDVPSGATNAPDSAWPRPALEKPNPTPALAPRGGSRKQRDTENHGSAPQRGRGCVSNRTSARWSPRWGKCCPCQDRAVPEPDQD